MKRYFLSALFVVLSSFIFAQSTPQMGLLMDDDSYEKVPLQARNLGFSSDITTIPSASIKQYVPQIKNQGQMGTCVGWSTAYYGRSILQAIQKEQTAQSQGIQQTFSPYFTYLNSNVTGDQGCMNGAFIHVALESLVNTGVPLQSDFNECATQIPQTVWNLARDYKIKDFKRLFTVLESDEMKIESVKRSLSNKNPVIIGFEVENSFFYSKNVFEPDHSEIQGGHAMCVVGYDDNKYGGAFEIVNSWGTNWGNEGFIWVRYRDFVNYTRYAYEMIPMNMAKEKTLAGKLVFELENGDQMAFRKGSGNFNKSVLGWQDVVVEKEAQSIGDYQSAQTFSDGTRYRMHVEVDKPSYVYVFAADSDQRNGILFPHKPEISPYISYTQTQVLVPGEKIWFRLNGPVDSDYSVVVFSENKVDTQSVLNQLNQMNGNLIDKLYLIFKDQLVAKENVNLSNQELAFNAKYTKGSMVMMVMDIRRR